MSEQQQRGKGRPMFGTRRRQRINVTLDPDVLEELDRRVPLKKHSTYIEMLIRRDLQLGTSQQEQQTA